MKSGARKIGPPLRERSQRVISDLGSFAVRGFVGVAHCNCRVCYTCLTGVEVRFIKT